MPASERVDGFRDDALICPGVGRELRPINPDVETPEPVDYDGECSCDVCTAYELGYNNGYKQGNYDFS